MLSTIQTKLNVIGATLLLIGAGSTTVLFNLWRHERAQREIAVENIAALSESTTVYRSALDTTRTSYARLQLQYTADTTAISASLHSAEANLRLTRAALNKITVEFAQLQQQGTSPQFSSDTARSAILTLTGPPIHGTVGVLLPLDSTRAALWNTDLSVLPLNLTYSLGCTNEHAPAVIVDAPSWATVRMQPGVVNPAVCHPSKWSPLSLFHIPLHLTVGPGIGVTTDGIRPLLGAIFGVSIF